MSNAAILEPSKSFDGPPPQLGLSMETDPVSRDMRYAAKKILLVNPVFERFWCRQPT